MEEIFETSSENYIKFGKKIIDVIMSDTGEFWFNAKQCALALGYTDTKQIISYIDSEDKIQLHKISHHSKIYRGHPHTLYLTEPGLYELLIISRKPKARKFRRWITRKVLPSIRKYGYYKLKEEYEKEKIEIIDKINYLQKQKTILEQDLKKESFPKEAMIYVIDYSNEKEVYRIGMTNDMEKRKQIYNTHTLHKQPVVLTKIINCPRRLEACMKAMLYNYRYKNRKDFYVCSLKIIKNAILDCVRNIKRIDCQTGGSQINNIPKNLIIANNERIKIINKKIHQINNKIDSINKINFENYLFNQRKNLLKRQNF